MGNDVDELIDGGVPSGRQAIVATLFKERTLFRSSPGRRDLRFEVLARLRFRPTSPEVVAAVLES